MNIIEHLRKWSTSDDEWREICNLQYTGLAEPGGPERMERSCPAHRTVCAPMRWSGAPGGTRGREQPSALTRSHEGTGVLMTAINAYLTEGRHPAGYPTWSYAFPNGHRASVIPDPHLPFHFEVCSSDPADASRSAVASGLTTEQVQAKLRALADLASIPEGSN